MQHATALEKMNLKV